MGLKTLKRYLIIFFFFNFRKKKQINQHHKNFGDLSVQQTHPILTKLLIGRFDGS